MGNARHLGRIPMVLSCEVPYGAIGACLRIVELAARFDICAAVLRLA
jgi:hypothetical protein